MLRQMNASPICSSNDIHPAQQPSRYSRNEKDDIKIAIDALYDFKKKLDELHPACVDIIENMMQRPRY